MAKSIETSKLSCIKFIVFCAALLLFVSELKAEVTVNWLDPLGYSKPKVIELALPDEASANKYYVDLNATGKNDGSSWQDAWTHLNQVKSAGVIAPAYIYVKAGDYGVLHWYGGNVQGSIGNEIVVKAYGDGLVRFSSTTSTNNNLDVSSSGSIHDIIFDGGENLEIEFLTHNAPRYGLTVRGVTNLTLWRCRFRAGAYSGMMIDVGSYSTVENINFINCEFYDANNVVAAQQNLYLGPGNGSWIKSGSIRNCIIRDMGGEGIEINPRDGNKTGYDLENFTIAGNVFHNVGKQTCFNNFRCRPAIVVDAMTSDGPASVGNLTIKNNLIWDTAAGGIWLRNADSTVEVYHNTIYDYDNYTNADGRVDTTGISDFHNASKAKVKNNIIIDPQGTAPFGYGLFEKDKNICDGCSIDYNINIFLTIDSNSSNFLQINSDSLARDAAVNVGVTEDYYGLLRPGNTVNDIGAHEFDSAHPTILQILF